MSSICSCAKVPKSSWPETPLPECRCPIIYTKERARPERGLGISLKCGQRRRRILLPKSTYTGGKCRNTDRGQNKNVNSPFHSLLKERCVFFCLRGLAPETCIFIQVARKKVRLADLEKKLRSQPGIRNRQENYSLSLSSCVILLGIFFARGLNKIKPLCQIFIPWLKFSP